MQINTEQVQRYIDYLETVPGEMKYLVDQMEGLVTVCAQCMDQMTGKAAAGDLWDNMENIRAVLPHAENATQRLLLVLRRVNDTMNNSFGGRSR